jgi:rRNA maturation protein Nop10
MNENCRAFTLSESESESDKSETVMCPYCGHYVALGLPHPDFSTKDLPIDEATLDILSQTTV